MDSDLQLLWVGDVRIEAQLIYHRVYKKLLEQKGLKEPDIVMESAQVIIKSHIKYTSLYSRINML